MATSEPPPPGLPSGLAVDFGGTKIAAARLVRGQVAEQVQVATDGQAGDRGQIAAMAGLLDRLEVGGADRIGVAVTGRVTAAGIWQALNSETLENVVSVPLRAILSRRFGRDVVVQNDAVAAALGEALAGAGRGYRSLAYVTVSTGVGGGIVLNGAPLRSDSGLAGHVGFTTSRIARDICGSGRAQTVESIASGRAIARLAALQDHAGLDAKAVFAAHLDGQLWARALIRQSAGAIAELCGNLKATLDLPLVLLGGSIGLAPGYLELVDGFLQDEPEIFRPKLVRAELGLRATFIGALAG
jgi:N-acylmannosamine kinase